MTLKLTLEQRVAQIEALLGPPPWAPLHSFTLEKVRETWVTEVLSEAYTAGTAIEIEDGEISHRFGNFGDIHTNYAEHAVAESITAQWSFYQGLDVVAGKYLTFGTDVGLTRAAANCLALATGDSFRSANYTSGVSGWDIAASGVAEFQDVWIRGELHGTVFVRDVIDSRAGTLVISKSAGTLAQDMQAEEFPTTWYMYIKDPPNGGFVFENLDICRIKARVIPGGTAEIWLTVSARTDMGDGTQRYTCGWLSGSAVTYKAGSAVVDYGQSGDGLLLMTAELNYAPYYDVLTHAGMPWSSTTLKVRVGNLAGVTDPDMSPSGYGLYAANAYLSGTVVAGGGAVILNPSGFEVHSTGDADIYSKWYNADITVYTACFGFANLQKTAPDSNTYGCFNVGVRHNSTNQANHSYWLNQVDTWIQKAGSWVAAQETTYDWSNFNVDIRLGEHHDVFPDAETAEHTGLFRRFVNKYGIDKYTHHRGSGAVVPSGCSATSTPSNLWAPWYAGYWGWLDGTYYQQYPNSSTLPAGLTVHEADPITASKKLFARIHTLGSDEFGLWADNFDANEYYSVGEVIYRFDVYAYGNGAEILLYCQCSTATCTVAGTGTGATFAAWVRHALSGPYGPMGVCGDGIVLHMIVNYSGTTSRCYAYVVGETRQLSGIGNQYLYSDAWPGTNVRAARRMGIFHRLQGFSRASWDWYYVE